MNFSKHSSTRQIQRAIPTNVLELLYKYGEEVHDHHGAVIKYFNRKARSRIRSDLGSLMYKRIESKLNAYLVEADDQVVTIGYRHRRIMRH